MKVSVIIPVYNVAPYIVEALRCLTEQTMQDFEVLLIDDHGSDHSIEAAKSYTGDDVRFRYLQTPQNAGPGVARNIGIEAARGEYIAFMDGDDRIDRTFLEMYNVATYTTSPYDLVFCQLQYRGGAKDGVVHHNPVVDTQNFQGEVKRQFLKHFVTFSVCFLFRREFLMEHKLRFPANRNSEDTNFLTRCLLLAQSIVTVDVPLYYYCVRESSLTTGRNRHRYKERLQAVGALLEEFKAMKRNPKYRHLRLQQYNGTMRLIWLKKGLAQSIIDIIKNLK